MYGVVALRNETQFVKVVWDILSGIKSLLFRLIEATYLRHLVSKKKPRRPLVLSCFFYGRHVSKSFEYTGSYQVTSGQIDLQIAFKRLLDTRENDVQ